MATIEREDSGMAYVRLVDSHVLIEGVPPESDTKNPEINLAQAEIRARQYNVDALRGWASRLALRWWSRCLEASLGFLRPESGC